MVKLTKSAGKPLLGKTRKTTKNKPLKAVKPAKKSFDFKEFTDSFKSLDQNNYGSWPTPVKITVLLFIVGIIALLTWFLPIKSKREDIVSAEAEKQTLLTQYREKESKARHLKEYEEQVAKMQADFRELLNQLPKDTRISDLVDGINLAGKGSNIRFQDIKVEPEVSQELFIEQPIRIAASGNYHEFGEFLSGLAKLPRIITLHDFEVSNPQPTLEGLPELNLVLNTKTYRSKEISEDTNASDNQGANDAK